MLKRITGLEMVQYRIPRTSLRPPFEVYTDTAYIDARCFKRYKRRFKPAAPAVALKKWNESLCHGWPFETVLALAKEVLNSHA